MESESSTPLFTANHEIATFLVSCGILSKAWEESSLANHSQRYSLNEYEGVAYVAFPSCHKIEGFNIQESKYGECNIQTDKFFSSCLKGNDDQPALVHQGALKLFLHIMENTDFQAKVRGNGTVYYPSNLEPWSETYGWKSPGFDLLKHAIEEAHSQNMALHAWVNVMPSWRGSHPPTRELHMYCSHPEWSWYDRYGNRQAPRNF